MKIKSLTMSILLSCVLITTLGCTTFFKRSPAQVRTDRKHYIMTLHGVRGNEKSYGDFHELIKVHLEKMDPSFTVIPLNYTYKIAQTDYSPYKAATEINNQLMRDVPVMGPEDKLSVVAYSMGGQVAVAWYYNSLNDPRFQQYPLKTANMIGLGAAYWGALEAGLFTNDIEVTKSYLKGSILELNRLSQELALQYLGQLSAETLAQLQNSINSKVLFPSIDKMQSMDQVREFYNNKKTKDYYPSIAAKLFDFNDTLKEIRNSSLREITKISFAELESLASAGQTVSLLRNEMTRFKLKSTKWVSISPLVQCFETNMGSEKAGCNDFQLNLFDRLNKSLTQYTFGYIRRETDNAVITPSSLAQFQYVVDKNPDYMNNELISAERFQYAIEPTKHKVIFAETLHATIVTRSLYEKALRLLGKLGASWERLADDVVLVYRDSCMNPDTCKHPVYKYIVEELSDCTNSINQCDQASYNNLIQRFKGSNTKESENQEKLKSELHGFSLDFKLEFPKDYDLKNVNDRTIFNYLKTEFTDDTNRIVKSSQNSAYNIQLGRRLELGSVLVKRISESNREILNVTLTGLITSKKGQNYDYVQLQNGLIVDLKIDFEGLRSRYLQIPVRPYQSNYINLTLAK